MKKVNPNKLRNSKFACDNNCTLIEEDYPGGLPLDPTKASEYYGKEINIAWLMHSLPLDGMLSLTSTWAEECLAENPAEFVPEILALIATPDVEAARTLQTRLRPYRHPDTETLNKRQALFGWGVANAIIAWSEPFKRTKRLGGANDIMRAYLLLKTGTKVSAERSDAEVACYAQIIPVVETHGSEFLDS